MKAKEGLKYPGQAQLEASIGEVESKIEELN